MPIKPHPTDPDKVVFVSHKPDEQAARIRVLEKALIKSEEDYDQVRLDYWRLFDENKRLLAEISAKDKK